MDVTWDTITPTGHLRGGEPSKTLTAATNSAHVLVWNHETKPRFLAIQDLRNCAVVVITSPQAAILAHITPAAPGASGGDVSVVAQKIQEHYFVYRDAFPPSKTQAMVALFPTEGVVPVGWKEMVSAIQECTLLLELCPHWERNTLAKKAETLRTSVIVDGHAETLSCAVYVNEKPVEALHQV